MQVLFGFPERVAHDSDILQVESRPRGKVISTLRPEVI